MQGLIWIVEELFGDLLSPAGLINTIQINFNC